MRTSLIVLSTLMSLIVFHSSFLFSLVQIIQGPDVIRASFHDNFPVSYAGISFRDQPADIGGKYAVFHAKENEYSNKRVFYFYINESGNITNGAAIGTDDIDEGYPSLDIDPETGNPLVAWNTQDGIKFSYDMYHLGSSGLWKTPFYIFDENTTSLHPDDFFQYPIVEIGNSPIVDKRRVYVVAKNIRTPNVGEQYVNAMLAYADFNEYDFNMQLTFDWTYLPLQFSNQMYLDAVDPYHYTFTSTDDGNLAIVGYSDNHEVFAFINNNFGEGDFVQCSELYEFPVDNPLNSDGSPRFVDAQGNPLNLYFAPSQSENTNAVFTHNNSKVIFPVSFALMAEPCIRFDDDCLLYPKVITLDINDLNFSFCDIHYRGVNPGDDIPMIPWDHNEDGLVDEYDENGYVTWLKCWPIYYPELDTSYIVNNYKISRNEQLGMSAILWSNGTNAKLASQGVSGYWQWEEVPEIALSVGTDGNPIWSITDLMSSYTFDELENMIPAYILPSSQIIDSGNDFHQIDLLFFNDYFFGPASTIPQPLPGGEMNIMKIEFYYEAPPPTYEFWINYPDGGETWFLEQTYQILWNPNGYAGPFDIQLLNNDSYYCDIIETVYGNSYTWTIPGSIEPGNQFSIRIYLSGTSNYSTSEGYFSILDPVTSGQILNVETELYQNTPNPFNPITTISFSLVSNDAGSAELSIFNSKGQKVKDLTTSLCHPEHVEGRVENQYSVIWNGTDDSDKPVSSGVYMYKLIVGKKSLQKKMLLLK